MTSVSSDRYTRIERRTLGGSEVSVHLAPDAVRVARRAGRPAYYGVRVGDRIKNAARDVSSPRVAEWRVTEISPERVVGEHVVTGDVREWDRETLERGLVVGNVATDLSAFETVAVHRVDGRAARDETAAGVGDEGRVEVGDEAGAASGGAVSDRTYRGAPYLTVVAYGNNGESYGLRYRFREAGGRDVELRERDPSVGRLPADRLALLESSVRDALEADGYVVHERADRDARRR
ncbi:MAG: hypothetical protein ABEJ22_06185 [Haloferacaceae archaeon]